MNLNAKLKQAADLWAVNKDYKRPAMPDVLTLHKEWRAANPEKYPYNATIRDFIIAREGVAPENVDMLETEVYLSQHDIDNEEKETNKAIMLAAGWRPLDKNAVDEAISVNKKLHICATTDADWMTIKINRVYKPRIFTNGQYGLMKPRATKTGYYLHQFANAFCKMI